MYTQNNVEQLVNRAITEVSNLQSGEKFMVRDLFLGYEWNRLSNYIRAQIGSEFYHQYAEDASEIDILEKSARNQQIYSKKETAGLKKIPAKVTTIEQLFGTLPDDIDYADIRKGRLSK